MVDLIVLGAGPAGYLAAERAAQAGFSVVCFEKKSVGGVCLNEGCIPSKTLLNSAKIYDYAKHDGQKYGVSTSEAALDHAFVIKRKDKVVRALVSGVETTLKKLKVEIVREDAKITGKSASGFNVAAGGQTWEAGRLLIATGSQAVVPPIPGVKEGLESGFVMTNREVFQLAELPRELVVIGGGVIGLELASYFNSADCHVTVIELLEEIGGSLDKEVAALLRGNYEKKGITFHTGCKVTSLSANAVTFQGNGNSKTISADKVLLSVGRRPSVEGLGLETLDVYTQRGAILTGESMQTNIPNVYAAGDVNGRSMLAHTAYREAEVSVNHMLGKPDRVNYNAIPGVIYTNPEVAFVGESEDSAQQKGFSVKTVKLPMQYSGRYMAENEGGNGFCKVVYDKKNDRILGIHMVGNSASEIIYGAGMLIDIQLPLEKIKQFVFPHPTVSEIIREAIYQL
jgi:dihydrolipoamide dehydrogenase